MALSLVRIGWVALINDYFALTYRALLNKLTAT